MPYLNTGLGLIILSVNSKLRRLPNNQQQIINNKLLRASHRVAAVVAFVAGAVADGD